MKKILVLCCVLFMLMPFQAFAHSKMTEAVPADNETVSASPEKISLKYNTSISSVSTFTLVNENGEEQQVDNITTNDNELSGDVAAVLANGTYTVQWNIIGADGHAIEGVSTFTVQAAEAAPTDDAVTDTEQEDEPSTEPTAEPTPEATVQPSADTNSDAAASDKQADSTKSPFMWPYVVIGLLIIAAVVFAMRKRK